MERGTASPYTEKIADDEPGEQEPGSARCHPNVPVGPNAAEDSEHRGRRDDGYQTNAGAARRRVGESGLEEDIMAFSFLPWQNVSDAFAGMAGAPVTVMPWGNHFALFWGYRRQRRSSAAPGGTHRAA